MANFDLIPDDYRYWIWQRNHFKRFAISGILCAISVIGISVYFHYKTGNILSLTEDLKSKLAIDRIQQNQLDKTIEQKNALEAQWNLLAGLRGGTAVEIILATIDNSLNKNDVWFLDWRFKRLRSNTAVNSTNDKNNIFSNNSQIKTQITIRGQAKDHSAFSTFVQNLIYDDNVIDVNIERTTSNRVNNINFVEFNIVVIMKSNLVSTRA